MSVEIIKYGDSLKGSSNCIDKSVLATCIKVNTQAKALADFAKGYQTGQLRNSLTYKTLIVNGGEELSVEPKQHEGFVGSASDHSVYVEFGTRNMDAQPYLRPAVDVVTKGADAESSITKIMNSEMTKAIRAGKKVVII